MQPSPTPQGQFTNPSRRSRLIFFAVAMIGALGLLVNTLITTADTWALHRAYGAQVAEMCDPPGGGAADAANMPTSTSDSLIILETGTATRHAWSDSGDAGELAVVACVAERWKEVETCSVFRDMAKGEDYNADVVRRQHTADVILFNAQTGDRITETALRGPEPRTCPADYSELVGESKQFIDGERVQRDTFMDWYSEQF